MIRDENSICVFIKIFHFNRIHSLNPLYLESNFFELNFLGVKHYRFFLLMLKHEEVYDF